MLARMAGIWEREAMSLDFLALGRSFGMSVWQTQSLWERLTDDPRYHLALDPSRWLRDAFRQRAAALAQAKRSTEEPAQPEPGRGGHYAPGIGKRTQVEVEMQGRGSAYASDIENRTLGEAMSRRGASYATDIGASALTDDFSARAAPVASELPFRAEVEELLGASLGDVRAYTNQDALLSPHGARAAAFRGGIAFAGTPTKEVVAHESVHTLQLRTAGVTRDATAAEAQAESAARAVSRGARRIAMSYVPTAAVSFDKGGGESAVSPPTALEAFLAINEIDIRNAIAAHLRDYGWPEPAEDVHFAANGELLFGTQLYRQLKSKLTSATVLQELVVPGDIGEEFHSLVDKSRGQDARAFGKSVSQLLQWAARDSLVERIGPQYRRLWAKNVDPPAAGDLAAKHPMDALVAVALTTPGVVDLREMPALEVQAPLPTASKTNAKVHKVKLPVASARGSAEAPLTVRQLMDVELSIGKRLDAIRDQVTPLGLAGQLSHATGVRAERVLRLADADAATLAHYRPILEFQHAQLITISEALPSLLAQYRPLRGLPDFALTASKRSERDQLLRQLSGYVRAAAFSDDKERSTAILKNIEVRERHQTRRSFDAAQRNAEFETAEVVASTPYNAPAGTAEGLDMLAHQRQAMLDGTPKGRSTYEQRKALIVGGEVALNARMQSAEHALEQLRQVAVEVYGEEKSVFDDVPGFRSLPWVVRDVKDHLADVRRTWDRAIQEKSAAVQDDSHAPDDWSDWKARRDALPIAQQAYAGIAGDQDLAEFFEEAKTKIRHQQIINAIVQLAEALLITVATGMGAAMLGEQAALAIASEGAGFGARAAAFGVNVGVNATINTAVQLAISQPTRKRWTDDNGKEVEESDGALVGSMLVENLLMDVFLRTLSAPLRKMQNLALEEGKLISTLPHLSKGEVSALSSFKFAGTGLAVEFIGGMSAQWAAHHLVEAYRNTGEDVSESFALTVLQQGAAIALGKFFHGQLTAWQQHQQTLEHLSNGNSEQAKRLFADRAAFYEKAKKFRDSLSPDPTDLHALLDLNERLIRDEHALVASAGAKERPALHADSKTATPDAAHVHEHLARVGKVSLALSERAVDGAKIDSQIAGVGHAQTDLHSHFMGNVPLEQIRDELARSGVDPMATTDGSTWEPLLRQIVATATNEMPHQTKDGVITRRGAAGDAVEIVERAQGKIDQLKRKLASSPQDNAIHAEIESVAKSAVDEALRASERTDFNSAYEVRDELVKRFYGASDRIVVMGGQGAVTPARNQLEAHFNGRPAVLERIQQAAALEARAEKLSGREKETLEQLQKLIREQFAYDQYALDTMVRLARDNVTYTEQSNSVKKLQTRFDEGQIEWLKTEAKRQHPELSHQIDTLVIKHLAMIETRNFGGRDAALHDVDPKRHGMSADGSFDTDLVNLDRLMKRNDVAGMDVAGVEHYRFDAEGAARFRDVYATMFALAKETGRRLVLRPHVGEGGIDTVTGMPFHRDANRQVRDGKLTHYERAENNIEVLVRALEDVANHFGKDGRLPDEVTVRFGHATHTTPDQAARMKQLGVIVEVNLGSNQATSAVTSNHPSTVDPITGQIVDRILTRDQMTGTFAEGEKNLPDLKDHSLATLIFNEVDVVLSTDGHEVMSTSLGQEFETAMKYLADVRTDEIKISITVQQARAMNAEGGNAAVGTQGDRETINVSYSELSSRKKSLFESAMRRFYETAHRYMQIRPQSPTVL